jgi:hypothetical protein
MVSRLRWGARREERREYVKKATIGTYYEWQMTSTADSKGWSVTGDLRQLRRVVRRSNACVLYVMALFCVLLTLQVNNKFHEPRLKRPVLPVKDRLLEMAESIKEQII